MGLTLTANDIRNAKSEDVDNTFFTVEINHPVEGWIPYFLTPHDTCTYIDNTALRELIGDNFAPYVPPTQEELDAKKSTLVRRERDYKLIDDVDPIVTNPLRWAELSEEKQNQWKQYRTDLLNISEQPGFPHTINWPTKPE